MNYTFRWALLGVTAVFMFDATNAKASGFQLKEQSSHLQGLSFAGATAKADDLSTIFFNPAGMTRFKGDHAEAHATYIKTSSKFTVESASAALAGGTAPSVTDGNGGDAGGGALIPSLYILRSIDEDTKVGLSVNTPFGLATEYDDGWVGRYYALKSELKTITIQPSIAHKIDSKWSVGAGIKFQYVEAELTKAINNNAIVANGTPDGVSALEGDDFAVGYNLGVLYEMNERTRFGLSYSSEVDHKLEGDLNISGASENATAALTDADVVADLTTPASLAFGAFHQVNDELSIMADAVWTGWTSFKELRVKNEDDGLVREAVDENWDDTYFLALGAEYMPDDKNTYQFGIAYDKSPVDTENRTFRIPGSDRTWVSLGYKRQLQKESSFNIGYSYIMADSAKITEDVNATLSGSVSGKYDDNHVHILSLGYHYKF